MRLGLKVKNLRVTRFHFAVSPILRGFVLLPEFPTRGQHGAAAEREIFIKRSAGLSAVWTFGLQ